MGVGRLKTHRFDAIPIPAGPWTNVEYDQVIADVKGRGTGAVGTASKRKPKRPRVGIKPIMLRVVLDDYAAGSLGLFFPGNAVNVAVIIELGVYGVVLCPARRLTGINLVSEVRAIPVNAFRKMKQIV